MEVLAWLLSKHAQIITHKSINIHDFHMAFHMEVETERNTNIRFGSTLLPSYFQLSDAVYVFLVHEQLMSSCIHSVMVYSSENTYVYI